jgi:uncharacterized membrane protein
MRVLYSLILLLFTFLPLGSFAQAELVVDTVVVEKARVIQVSEDRMELIGGTDRSAAIQTLRVEILGGPEEGEIVIFENDYIQLKEGDIFYLRHLTNNLDGSDYWSVADPDRLPVLIILTLVFLALLFLFGGWQGVRGLTSLIGSLVLIGYALLPGILAGYSPVLVSIGVTSLIIILGSYITHGFTRTTTSAVLGMLVTVLLTGLGAYWAVHAASLSGYASEESVYLNFNTDGAIDMIGLLFSAIMIGLLGVLYDIAISQAVAVEELFRAGKHMTRLEVYRRGIRIGREHIGALVNTLAIAYVGAGLPLLLLTVSASEASVASLVNSELFATEIVRILVGSIGLILAVPITTLISSRVLSRKEGTRSAHAEELH